MQKVELKGITWNHSRGYTPLVATAQRFHELHPHITIQWDKRTLQEFADYPIEKLTAHYDLLIIDHPWVGCAAATNTVIDLKKHLSAEYLLNQEENSVGQSYESYIYNNGLWALPIDAAAPFASYRKDLLDAIPQTWDELIDLAKQGKVAVPAIPIDLLMNFYSFSIALNKVIFSDVNFIEEQDGLVVLEKMKELYGVVDKKMFSLNPIGVAELMSSTNEYAYCPFAYGYSNYARNGFAKHKLTYADVITIDGNKLKTTIGGTGIAVSSTTKYVTESVAYASWVCTASMQETMYTENGGQPGHKAAWLSEHTNKLTNDYFNTCLPIMENGYMRPRYNGYLHFQDHAGLPLQKYLMGELAAADAIKEMNKIYKESKP